MDLQQKTNIMVEKFKRLGSQNVYFEPPKSAKINYPCTVFKRTTMSSRSADNRIYKKDDAYDVTLISRMPDDEMVHILLDNNEFNKVRHIRHYEMDGLHHDQFKIFY